MPSSFDYAIVRIVPFVEREEFFNAGVILFCPEQKFLGAQTYLDPTKLDAFASGVDTREVERRLDAIERVCSGEHSAGPIAQLPQRARFHWLVSPRSTVVQISPVHSGICEEPRCVLARLFREQVLTAKSAGL